MPSGNFGNILAGHVARQMGLPIRRLILATNENDVLDEFFRTGRYRPRATSGNARDVEPVDGHLEGVELRALSCSTSSAAIAASCASCGTMLERDGGFDLSGHAVLAARRARPGFVSGASTHRRPDRDDTRNVRRAAASLSIRTRPTAQGRARRAVMPAVPLVCIETALPAKFAATIREALGRDPPRPAAYADLESRPQRCTVVPADSSAVEAIVAKYALAAGAAAPQRERA